MRSSLSVILICLAASAAFEPEAHAGGFHITIMGVRRTSMFTVVANPDDATALFHNPAGLADQPGTRLFLSGGLTLLHSAFRLQELDPQRFPEVNAGCGGGRACPWPVDAEGYYEASIGPERYFGVIPYLGFSKDLGGLSPDLRRVVVSAAIYAPGAYGATLPAEAPTAYYVTDGLFVVLAATGGVGWRINDQLAVGASFSYNFRRLSFAQKFSTVDILTPAGVRPHDDGDPVPELAQATLGDLRLDFGGSDHGIGWGAGVLYRPFEWAQLGAAAMGFTSASFEGDVSLSGLGSKISGTAPLDPVALRQLAQDLGFKLPERLRVGMPIPPAFSVGLSLWPSPQLEIGLEGRLYLYQLYQRQEILPIYASAEPGEEAIATDALSKNKHYRNSLEASLGVRFQPLADQPDFDLLAGVSFDASPVPDETFSIDNPSMNQLVFGVGFRLGLGAGWRIGGAYLFDLYLARDVRTSETSPPTNVKGSGYSQIPTIEVSWTM